MLSNTPKPLPSEKSILWFGGTGNLAIVKMQPPHLWGKGKAKAA